MDPLLTILICLSSMFIVSELLHLVSVPRVVSQILVGILLGLPAISSVLFADDALAVVKFLSYMGSILLLFFVGLQLDLRRGAKNLKGSFFVSFFNTIIPLTLGFLVSKYFFHLSNEVSVIIGVCMSVSAVAFALDILEEYGKLRTKLAAFIIEAGSIDDVVESLLFATILGFISTITEKFDVFDLIQNIFIFLVVLLLFRFVFIPLILRLAEKKISETSLFTSGLLITLVLVALADSLGISALIGALLGGIVMRYVLKSDHHRPWELHAMTRSVHSVGFGFLVPFFFLWVGINTDVVSIFSNLHFSVIITIIAIFGTVFGTMIGYLAVERNWKRAWLVGWAVNAKGDTELIMATLALSAGIISTQIFSSLIFMAVVSTLVSPIVFRYYLKWF